MDIRPNDRACWKPGTFQLRWTQASLCTIWVDVDEIGLFYEFNLATVLDAVTIADRAIWRITQGDSDVD